VELGNPNAERQANPRAFSRSAKHLQFRHFHFAFEFAFRVGRGSAILICVAPEEIPMLDVVRLLLIGLGIGVVSGLLGIGGGVLLVPLLMLFCGFSFAKARGTSLAVLVMPVVLPAAWRYFHDLRDKPGDSIDVSAAVWIAASFIVGGYIGAALVSYLPAEKLRLCFGLVMLFIAMRYIISTDDDASAAAAGLLATVMALIVFAVLRVIGRRYMPPPNLGTKIQEASVQEHTGPDYYI
jgi:hypothetical protein